MDLAEHLLVDLVAPVDGLVAVVLGGLCALAKHAPDDVRDVGVGLGGIEEPVAQDEFAVEALPLPEAPPHALGVGFVRGDRHGLLEHGRRVARVPHEPLDPQAVGEDLEDHREQSRQ